MSQKRRDALSQSGEGSNAAPKRTKAPSRSLSPDQILIGGSVVVTAVILIIAMVVSSQNNYLYNSPIEGVEEISSLVASHVVGQVNYPQIPPAGGAHNQVWQTCGVYTAPIANEHAVHSLEHGAVWITYQPNLPGDQIARLQDITRQSSHRLLSPYVGIDSPIIVSAWGFQLRLQSVDDPRLTQFIAQYEQGPNTPEPGATCSGGETRTLIELGGLGQ
jgi:hypothetical protein